MAVPLQSFIDSDAGQVVATTLHTAGAILYLGGLAAYLSWHRHLLHGQHQVRVLAAASAATYVAILANLAGGFMRTYAEGHPGLSAIGDSPWVRIMVVKHAFLFAGMAAAVYLFELVAPRLVRASQEGTLSAASRQRHHGATFLVGASILAAAVLGAFSQVTPLTDGGAPGPEPPIEETGHVHAVSYHNATGQLTSTPVQPRTGSTTFQIPAETSSMEATLTWSPTQFDLRLELAGPGGASTSFAGDAGRLEAAVEGPAAGTWTARVASDAALAVEWILSVRISPGDAGETFLAETVVVPGQSFFEINTEMPLGATLWWDWTTLEGIAVHFDVHSHFDEEVQYWVEEEAVAGAGNFTNEREGGYSYLWENRGATPVRLQYRAWGGFEVDSYFPPRG